MRNQSVLKQVIVSYENTIGCGFKPDHRFYDRVGINHKRFGQLIRGEKPLYVYEALNLSKFFGIPLEYLCKTESPATTGNSAGQSSNV